MSSEGKPGLCRAAAVTLLSSCAAVLPLLAGDAFALPEIQSPNPSVTEAETSAETVSGLDDLPPPPPVRARPFSASLADALDPAGASPRLGGMTTRTELRFDLSHAETVDSLSLHLRADTLPGAGSAKPLQLRFNGSNPVLIEGSPDGIDTVLRLDPRRSRATGNVLTLSLPETSDGSCEPGGYEIALDQSRLDLGLLPGTQRLDMREAEARFASPVFAPRTVGLVASGADRTRLQALAAQAMGSRLNHIPEFRLSAGDADFDLIMVPRHQLSAYTDDPAVLDATGPALILSEAPVNRLFLTGDTDEDVLASVQAFAAAFLPDSRRSSATPDEVRTQSPLGVDRMHIRDRATLDLLTVQTGESREFLFDVSDPLASSGMLELRLHRGRQTRPGTRLSATLNGEPLGEARVRGRHATVSYPIEAGRLRGTRNRLELRTLHAGGVPDCEVARPFIAISEGSELRLETETPTLETDLSRLAADANLFAAEDGAQTLVLLPESDTDFIPALSLLARFAQASGKGWTEAGFAREADGTDEEGRNRLILQPEADIDRALRLAAPRALQNAWMGATDPDGPARKFASLDGSETVRQAASLVRDAGTITDGGVAALFPAEDGTMLGVISNTGDLPFAEAIATLVEDTHWNALRGAVTHWTDDSIVMAQDALPPMGYEKVFDMVETDEIPEPDAPLEETSPVQEAEIQQTERSIEETPALEPSLESTLENETEPTLMAALGESGLRLAVSVGEGFSAGARSALALTEPVGDVSKRKADDVLSGASKLSQDLALPDRIAGLRGSLGAAADKAGLTMASAGTMLRDRFWAHLDIPQPGPQTARIGRGQVLPLLALLSLLALILSIRSLLAGTTYAGRRD